MIQQNVSLLLLIQPRENHGVAKTDLLFREELLSLFNKVVQFESLMEIALRFSDFGGESCNIVSPVLQKLLVTNGLIEWMDILPLEVFDVKHFHILLVVHLSDLHGHRRQFEHCCGVVAAVTCRNLVFSWLRRRPHEQRRQNSIGGDTRHQLRICRWIPPTARVAWRWFNCVDRTISKLHTYSLIECFCTFGWAGAGATKNTPAPSCSQQLRSSRLRNERPSALCGAAEKLKWWD